MNIIFNEKIDYKTVVHSIKELEPTTIFINNLPFNTMFSEYVPENGMLLSSMHKSYFEDNHFSSEDVLITFKLNII